MFSFLVILWMWCPRSIPSKNSSFPIFTSAKGQISSGLFVVNHWATFFSKSRDDHRNLCLLPFTWSWYLLVWRVNSWFFLMFSMWRVIAASLSFESAIFGIINRMWSFDTIFWISARARVIFVFSDVLVAISIWTVSPIISHSFPNWVVPLRSTSTLCWWNASTLSCSIGAVLYVFVMCLASMYVFFFDI